MKWYSCIIRWADGDEYYQHIMLYRSNNSKEALDYIEHDYGSIEGKEIKIIPSGIYPADGGQSIHEFNGRVKITKEEFEKGLCDNDIFLGGTDETLRYDGDCVFISFNGIRKNKKIDTTNYEQFIQYCEEHDH